MLSYFRIILLLLGVIAIFSFQKSFAALPDGLYQGDWKVQNDIIAPNANCLENSIGCKEVLFDQGFFQSQIQASGEYYYSNSFNIDEVATGDPQKGRAPYSVKAREDTGVNFWNETFLNTQCDSHAEANDISINNFVAYVYNGIKQKEEKENPCRQSASNRTQRFTNSFKIFTGVVNEKQFGGPETGKYINLRSTDHTIGGFAANEMSDNRTHLPFQESILGLEKDPTHNSRLISNSKDNAISENGVRGEPLFDSESYNQMFDFY